MHDIPVLHEIIFSFRKQFTGCTALRLATKSNKIIVFDNLRADKSAFKVRMDNTGALRRFGACFERPRANFIASGSEERAKVE